MTFILTKKSNGEAVFRKQFRTLEYAGQYLALHFDNWQEHYDLEIIY